MINKWKPMENFIIRDSDARKQVLDLGFSKTPSIGSEKINELKSIFAKYHDIKEEGMFYSLYSKDVNYREQTHNAIRDTLKDTFDQYFTGYKSSFNLFIIKTGNTKEEFYIHQDPSYIDELKYSPLHIWIPLEDITENNGGLCFVRKSHLFFAPYRNISFNPPYENIKPFIRQYLEPIFARAGEMLVFDPRLLHNSLPNNTDETRIAILCGLFPEEAEIVSCYKDDSVKDSPVEFYKQREDFFITYPDFFESCRMRPVVGEWSGTAPYDYSFLTEEQFAEICESNGVKPVNFLNQEEAKICRMFGEPVTT